MHLSLIQSSFLHANHSSVRGVQTVIGTALERAEAGLSIAAKTAARKLGVHWQLHDLITT